MNDEKLSKLYNEIAEVVIDTIPRSGLRFTCMVRLGKVLKRHIFITTLKRIVLLFTVIVFLKSLMSRKKNILRSGIVC